MKLCIYCVSFLSWNYRLLFQIGLRRLPYCSVSSEIFIACSVIPKQRASETEELYRVLAHSIHQGRLSTLCTQTHTYTHPANELVRDVYEESLTNHTDQEQMPSGIQACAGADLTTVLIPAYESLECHGVS